MARRPIKPKAPVVSENVVLGHYDASQEEIVVVMIEGAETMIIIDEKSPIWKTKKLGGRATFVTLAPPPDVDDQTIDELKTRLYAEHGARVVHVRPRTKSLTVVAQEVYEEKSVSNAREIVMTMVEEANTTNRDALRARLEETLASVGL